MSQNINLHTLDDPVENQKLVLKLPEYLCQRWNRKATLYQLEYGRFPNFSYFVTFLSMEASIACNPVTSYHALWASEPEKSKTKSQGSVASRTQTFDAKSFSTNINDNWVTCIFCKETAHSLQKCHKFLEQPVTERVKFVQHEHLCFGCLNPGHQSRSCKRRLICDYCSRRHPSCLHEDRLDQESKQMQAGCQEGSASQTITAETTSNRILENGSSSQTSAIVPVIVSNNWGKEILVYALLDSQSDSSFILHHVADALDMTREPIKLKPSTMSSRETIVSCQRLKDLQIRGLNSIKKITVPTVYTCEFIPANRSHIPTPEIAKAWPHLEHLVEHIAPQNQCEIGLLIGYNCPQALMPREDICGKENEPFAQRTDLGWSIVSYGDPGEQYSDVFGVSHHIIVKQVIPQHTVLGQLKGEVHYVFRTKIKETIAPDDVGDDKVGEVSGSDPELKAVQVFSTKAREERTLLDRLTKFSDWKRAVKAVACLKHYVKHFSSRKSNYSYAISIEERQEAELFIIKLVQHDVFSSEMESIQRAGEVRSKDQANKLHRLSPFIDEHGVLRVGGQLIRSTLHLHVKHPAIIPKASHVSSLFIKYYHEKIHHQGRGITVNELRANGVWVIGCSSAVAAHIFKCTTCRKYRSCTQKPKMADLPIEVFHLMSQGHVTPRCPPF
ncbi:uncharacterized protein LOC132870456 [Neoarius graeffei]|uniref:uncharacterized protein LOC132870456 n=1 Tax=Neoarius graeffei TaxID=443677 RepID=UPI00298CE0E8|nr:uncharacterized protein LOC132870456 [Neoarius graeffei]XP_060760081.1 uncharacterized protein LOC132870456 [Neoarius graeffei]XP_060760082.1 uncharacterized protein LOC132870456 [Neoarius graeffei]